MWSFSSKNDDLATKGGEKLKEARKKKPSFLWAKKGVLDYKIDEGFYEGYWLGRGGN